MMMWLRCWLINLAYGGLLLMASPWLLYVAVRFGKYRCGWPEKLLGRVPKREGNLPCIWFHAVSVGEVNLLQTVLDRIAVEYPQHSIYITTTTLTGFELAQRKYSQHTVSYCPLDFSWAIENALDRIRPAVLMLAELELWPNLIALTAERGVPVAVINGRLSDKSFRGYQRFRPWLHFVFSRLSLVAAQTQTDADRFRALGAPQVHCTGNLKFDGVSKQRANPATQELARLAGIQPHDVVFLAGSTQAPEEGLAVETFRQLAPRFPALRLLLVPRHPERFAEVAELLEASGLPWSRRTSLTAPSEPARILLVDSVGELQAWWGTAGIAFVGGSMGTRGGQNMLEPAAYGAAVSFGPNTRNFRQIVAQLLAAEAAMVVEDGQQLTAFVERCLQDPDWASELGHNAQALVASGAGATTRTLELLRPLFGNPSSPGEFTSKAA